MKTISLITVLIFAASIGSFARKPLAEGTTNSVFGNYKIEIDNEIITINGRNHIPYVITYENTGMEVRVAVDMDSNGKKYYVLSDNLSVQYVANGKCIGVTFLDKELEKDGFKTSPELLDRSAYFHQKLIATDCGDQVGNTRLIATFYPLLFNDSEKMLAAK